LGAHVVGERPTRERDLALKSGAIQQIGR